MTTQLRSLWIPAALAGLLVACASGGGREGPRPGVDAGPRRDAAPPRDGAPPPADAGPPKDCETAADCDDGLVCTGADSCSAEWLCEVTAHAGCDDGVSCTVDACTEPLGDCTHVADDSLCPEGQVCDETTGCEVPPACLSDAECDDGLACNGLETCDPSFGCRGGTAVACDDGVTCTADSCVEPAGTCQNVGVDADGDGFIAMGCLAGNDCNDMSAAVRPGAVEACNGIDDDCSGAPDDGGGLACALGSVPSACTTSCGTAGTRPCTATCTFGACAAATETCGNMCDDNGNGMIDEGCAAPPPPNDQCAGATVLTASGTRSDTLVGATAQTTDCGSGVEVFYRAAVSRRSIIYLDTFGSGFDTRISYRGTACPGASTTCVDDSCASLQTQLAVVVNAGTHYFGIHTFSSSTTPGPIAVRYQIVDAAGGDTTLITARGTFGGSTSGASAVGATCGGSAASAEDAFYWLQCPSDTRSVTATTCSASTSYDTVLHLHGTAQIACNDDDFACSWGSLQSNVTGATVGAGVFRLFVDGYSSSSTGSYSVNINW